MLESVFSYILDTVVTIVVMYYFCIIFALIFSEYDDREGFIKDLIPFRAIYRKFKELPKR
jgi:hypothetical protein